MNFSFREWLRRRAEQRVAERSREIAVTRAAFTERTRDMSDDEVNLYFRRMRVNARGGL